MYKAIDLSKYIVTKCVNEECPISNLQLQKILYYIQREFLRLEDRIIFPEAIEAWQFGPVVPVSYYKFCAFGAMPIGLTYDTEDVEEHDKAIIDSIIVEKRSLDPWALVDDTHQPGKAWSQIYNDGKGNHEEIPIELIKSVG